MGFSDSSVGKESSCSSAEDPSSIPGSGRSTGEEIGYPLWYSWASLVAQLVKNLPAMRETWVWSLSWEDPLEKGTTAAAAAAVAKSLQSCPTLCDSGSPVPGILQARILEGNHYPLQIDPWVGKILWRRERLPTLVFWPGEFHGLYGPWGRKKLNRTERFSLSMYVYMII